MDKALDDVCQTVMRGVAASGVIRATRGEDDNVALATRVMREEIKAFLTEPRYHDQRQALVDSDSMSGIVLATLVLTCVERIAQG